MQKKKRNFFINGKKFTENITLPLKDVVREKVIFFIIMLLAILIIQITFTPQQSKGNHKLHYSIQFPQVLLIFTGKCKIINTHFKSTKNEK